jgi:NADPH:quinone reductase-like Zn-dependent oxidoreductase
MRAAVYRSYGAPEVIELRDVPTPTPKPNEVLVQISAST